MIKGLTDTKCWLSQLHEEILTPICICEEANRKMAGKMVDGLKEWIDNSDGEDLERRTNNTLRGKTTLEFWKKRFFVSNNALIP